MSETMNIEKRLREEQGIITLSQEKNKPEDFFDGNKFIPKILGDAIMKDIAFKTLRGSHEIYYYEDGYYKVHGHDKIQEKCIEYLGESYKKFCCMETTDYIIGNTFVEPDSVNTGWINLENGLLDPITLEFKEHTPDIFSIIRVPIIYNPEADCPIFRKELKKRVDKNIMNTVQEMFGYCFDPSQKYERAFLMYGPRRSFKGTTLRRLQEILGIENCVAISLQKLNEDGFSLAYTYGKMANIHPELTSRYLKNTEIFMTITGQDLVTAAKKHGHSFTWSPTTKQIYACNHIPPTSNKNLAFYRRWIPLPFLITLAKDKVNPDIEKEMQKELPGILNWALNGLKRLNKNEKFSYNPSDEDIKDFWEKYSDSIQSFVYNEIDTEDDLMVLVKRKVYQKYKEYCEENDLKIENQIYFGRMFLAHTGCGTCKQDGIPAYKGVTYMLDIKKVQKGIDDFEG